MAEKMIRARIARFLFPLRLNLNDIERGKTVLVCLAMLAVAVALRLHTASWYDPYMQHDPNMHFSALVDIVHLRFPHGYNGPYYYLAVALLSAPFSAAFDLGVIGKLAFLKTATVLSNTIFLAVYLYGCLLLARRLGFRFYTQFAFVALCLFFPPIQRSLSMLRPENLLLALSPYVCVYAMAFWRGQQFGKSSAERATVWPAVGLLILMAAQKISGMFFAAGLGGAVLAFIPGTLPQRIARLWRPAVVLCTVAVVLVLLQRVVCGAWFFSGGQADWPDYQATPTARIFLNVDPVGAWRNPFRDNHADSMADILMIDMFGDYWRYGIDHYANKEAGNTVAWRLARARFGLVITWLYIVLYAAGVIALLWSLRRAQGGQRLQVCERLMLAALFYIGLVMLGSATVVGYNARKFDIIKWEYIGMFIPFLMIPVAHLLDAMPGGRVRKGVLGAVAIVVAAGIVQSIHYVPGA